MTSTRILALDTTSPNGSVALFRDHELLSERHWSADDTHSSHVIAEVRECLAEASMSVAEITCLVPVIGPGSFTGIRIGLGTVEGLAMAYDLPVVGVSALEAVASLLDSRAARAYVVLDAYRNQVYTQAFDCRGAHPEPVGAPGCDFPRHWLETLAGDGSVFVGSGAVRYRQEIEEFSIGFQVQPVSPWLAAPAARLAEWLMESGRVHPEKHVDALYVRPPDAKASRRPPAKI